MKLRIRAKKPIRWKRPPKELRDEYLPRPVPRGVQPKFRPISGWGQKRLPPIKAARPRFPEKRIRMLINIYPHEREALRRVAHEMGLSMSAVVRLALRRILRVARTTKAYDPRVGTPLVDRERAEARVQNVVGLPFSTTPSPRVVTGPPSAEQEVVNRLAGRAPDGTTWDEHLDKTASRLSGKKPRMMIHEKRKS